MQTIRRIPHCLIAAGLFALLQAAPGTAVAYSGTQCKRPGDCWEPKPGYPQKIAGTKYDPRHDPKELDKQAASVKAMEARNAKRVEAAAKTGTFKFDVK